MFTRPSLVELLDVQEPVPGPDEVLVEVAAAGICGSELHGIRAPGFRTPPLVMGHEFAGTTPDGRRVAVNPIVSCGRCDLCRLGRPQLCRHRAIIGVHRPGAFAERVAVPSAALHPLPPGMTWEAAAVVEPIANAVHAWELAGGPVDARIGIVGAGTIGLACLIVAVEAGAARVAVADPSGTRLEVARRLGAGTTAPELDGEYDVVFDAVGLAVTRRASVARLRPGGTAVWLGLVAEEAGFDATELVRMEKRVTGSFAYTGGEFAAAIERAARCELGWVRSFPLADGPAVFTALMHGGTDPVKALLRP